MHIKNDVIRSIFTKLKEVSSFYFKVFYFGVTVMRIQSHSLPKQQPFLFEESQEKRFKKSCLNCSKSHYHYYDYRRRLSCFERVERNLQWIHDCLNERYAWSAVAELLEMSPVTLIRHYDRLTAKYVLN